jgi:hypothetical protein
MSDVAGGDAALPVTYGFGVEGFAQLISRWRQRALGG